MAIYNGTQKVDLSGIDKVYVGSQLVYQKVNKQVVSIRVGSWPNDTDDRCFTPFSQLGVGPFYCWYQPLESTFSFPGTIIATYDDASEEDVTSQCIFSGYNMSAETGNMGQGITVSYTYNGNTVQITNTTVLGTTYWYIYLQVKKVADYIVLSGYNTNFYKNDTFAYGGTVTAYYLSGSSNVVTSPLSFTGFDMSTAGTYTVNVNYYTQAKWNLSQQTKTTASVNATYTLTVSEWIELWSGNVTRTRDATGTAVSTDIASFSSSELLSGNNTFRITYSMAGTGSTVSYQENGSSVSNYHSPLSTTINVLNPDSQTTYTVAQVRGGTSAIAYYQVQLRWEYSGLKFYLYDNKSVFGTPTDSSATMTVTKIERYIP